MRGKCYPITAALMANNVADQASFDEKWYPIAYLEDRWVWMARNLNTVRWYAPLHIRTMRMVQPHTLVESEKFNLRYGDPDQIDHTADKLRWYRYRKGLRQRDVAAAIGVDRSTYVHMESRTCDYYPPELLERLSGVFDTSVEELLDEYNRFLYGHQGDQIRQMRIERGISQHQFARHLGTSLNNVKKWEQERVRISRWMWNRYFDKRM